MAVSYTNPESLADPLGAYSHLATASGSKLVAVAGQVALDPGGKLVGEGDCGRQVEQVFANLGAALGDAGLGPGNILQMITYLVRPGDIEAFYATRKRVFAEMFPDGRYPPNTLLVVQRLVRAEFLVEIEALAAG